MRPRPGLTQVRAAGAFLCTLYVISKTSETLSKDAALLKPQDRVRYRNYTPPSEGAAPCPARYMLESRGKLSAILVLQFVYASGMISENNGILLVFVKKSRN